jgi:drug/metabolite transporter (DMT)-like permease
VLSTIKSFGTTAILLAVVPLQPPRLPPTAHPPPPLTPSRPAPVPLLIHQTPSILCASAELGIYTAAGSVAQACGLAHVSATAAGFIIQLTTVFTPLLAVLAGQDIKLRTLTAIALALVGTVLTVFESIVSQEMLVFSRAPLCGVLLLVGAAACYSLATLRISVLAPGVRNNILCCGLHHVLSSSSCCLIYF